MNNTFSRVAALCGLRLSYYVTAAMLAIAFLVFALTGYQTASPLYILLTLAVLPSLVKSIFISNQNKEKNKVPAAYPLFCKKYHYSAAQYKVMSIAYLFILILLAAWHISYFSATALPAPIPRIPSLIAALSLLTRILGVLGYRLYFHLFPLKAMR